jgi:hypothetical protein
MAGFPKDRHSRQIGRDLFKKFEPFRAYAVLEQNETVPPGRAKLSTKPAPTGSTAGANTIGTVRVAACNAAQLGSPWPG